MKVTISQAAPTPSGLVLGLRVELQNAGWIRFATTVLVVDDLDLASRQALTAALNNFLAPSDLLAEDLELF